MDEFRDARLDTSIWLISQIILLYDYAITLGDEVHHVWPYPLSFGVLLFYANRYLVLVEVIVYSYLRFIPLTIATCSRISLAAICLSLTGMFVANLIIYLRTYAMWGRNRIVFYILLTLTIGLGSMLSTIVVLQIIRTITSIANLPNSSEKIYCAATLGVRTTVPQIFLFYGVFCITEGTVTVLTLIKAQQHLRQPTSSWVRQLYNNGIIYCVSMTVLSTTNLVIAYRERVGLKLIFTPLQRNLHSVFANRIIFLIMKHRHRLAAERSAPRSYIGSTMDVFTTVQHETSDAEMMSIRRTREERTRTEWVR